MAAEEGDKLRKTREDNLLLAKLAQQAERYDEMLAAMEKVARSVQSAELNLEERNLLALAYKNAYGTRLASWRLLREETEKLEDHDHLTWMREYRDTIEAEMMEMCESFVSLLDEHLLPNCTNVGARILYLRLKGDYHRFIVEIKASAGEETTETADFALQAYKEAQEFASTHLPCTDPRRLALDLHLAVFHFKILNSPEEARAIARNALEAATTELREIRDSLSPNSYTERVHLMRKLRSNYTIWDRDDGSNTEDKSRYEDDFEDGDM